METPGGQPDDERLRELLAVEQRLQDFVRAAEEDAARRIAAADAAREQRLRAAREAAARADAEQARADRIAYQQALATIATAGQAVVTAIASLSDERVDELARWAVDQVISGAEDAV